MTRSLDDMCRSARQAARTLALAPSCRKDGALLGMAAELRARSARVLEANRVDLDGARASGLSEAMIERLSIDAGRVEAMARGIEEIAALPDPVGRGVESHRVPQGLDVQKVRVPLGVVAMVYESRPNVTSDAAALCLKSGNAALLRGGSEAARTNRAIADGLIAAVLAAGLPDGTLALFDEPGRDATTALLARPDLDLLVPRGGRGLKRAVQEHARSPYVMTGMGLCHLYLDASADPAMSASIAVNAKAQRPSVCNAIETLLVHRDGMSRVLPPVVRALEAAGVELRGDEEARSLCPMAAASDEDWDDEYLDLILSVKTVGSLAEAMDHIARHGSGHSEAIVTSSYEAAETFLRGVDAAAVYVNASTRFTDGGVFGLGAEMGISTQKLHARGPMGVEQLTSTKYVVRGSGQVRS